MPLVICVLLFFILFSGELYVNASRKMEKESALERFEMFEYPNAGSDRYIDELSC